MANGCYGTYSGTDFDYIQPTITQTPVFSSEGALTHYIKEFTFRAFFSYANQSAFDTGRDAIDTSLQLQAQTLTIKDTSAATLWSFGSSDVLGDGPYTEYSYEESMGYTFYVNVKVKGDIEPGGTGAIVDTYEDRYAYNKQKRITYTRTGTQRNSTAYSDSDAALDAVDPAPTPANKWEYVSREGTFDKDFKQIKYTYVYINVFDPLPAQFASLQYSEAYAKDGRRNSISFSATGGVDFKTGDNEGLRVALEDWGKGKLPEGSKISSINSNLDRRNGSCTLSITATAPIAGDIIAFQRSTSLVRTEDFVIRRRLGGGGTWKQRTGDPVNIERVSGTATGLNNYPPGLQGDWDRLTNTKDDPFKGPDGDLLYTINFSGDREIVTGGSPGGGAVGGGGGGGGKGSSGGGNAPGKTGSGSRTHLVGISDNPVALKITWPGGTYPRT